MADLNVLPVVATARQPRGAVKLAGTVVAGWIEFEVDNNNFRSADTFDVTFAVNGLPKSNDAAWFATQKTILVEIFLTAKPADPAKYAPTIADRIIYGQVDDIDFDPCDGTIKITGRDLTALLIDTKGSENHQNQTASDVATLLAARHNLTPVVTTTTKKIGEYYSQDHTDLSQQESEWDLLIKLADFEGFDVFVAGNELHFQPKPKASGDHYAIVWTPPTVDTAHPSLNTTKLNLSRSLTIAKGVVVEVKTWNAKQKKAFTASWPKTVKATKPGQSGDDTLKYHFTVPGLTQDQASALAQQRYNEIVQHMVKLDADLPGDAILDCSKTIIVRGTATGWDQVYYPDSVKRSMSMDEGYRMSVSAKNISADVEAAAGA